MNKKTAIIVGVIILVLTSIVTPFFIRKLNKKVEVQTQEQNEVQEPPIGVINEPINKSGEQASEEQTEENQTESEVEEDGNSEKQTKVESANSNSTKLKSSLQGSTTKATSNEKQPAKEERVSTPQVQVVEEIIEEVNEPVIENTVVIDVANVTEQITEQPQVPEQVTEVPEAQNIVLPDGAVGILKIDKLGINQKVADGHSLEVLKTDLGHVDSTAYASGNIGILGHNSGNAGYFKNLWDLKQDDVIEYTTSNGTKTYKVSEVVQIADDDWSKLAGVVGPLSESNIYIDDTPGISVMDIRTKCRKLKMEHNIGLVIIDYLQLVQGSNLRKNGSREQEIAEISRSLKILAKELNVPVIALSQLSRAVEQRPDHRPMLSDLRESGSIEQDADIVMFLYRDDYYNKDSEDKGLTEVILAKHRGGSTGMVKLIWMGNYTKFADWAKFED